ncbi:MAG: hypothetical protein ACJ74A_10785 [Gaiellaceae bacterium]
MRSLLAIAAGAVILVTGCGGSNRLSADAYRAKLHEINGEVSKTEGRAEATVVKARSVEEMVRALAQLARAHDRIGDEVAALKPPKRAEAANDLFVRGSHDVADEIRALLPRLSLLESPRKAQALLGRLGDSKGGKELDRAIAEWQQKGY